MPTTTATSRLARLERNIRNIDTQMQLRDGSFIPTDIDVIGSRTYRDEPILLVRTAGETLALRDEGSYNEKGDLVPGFLDRNNEPVATATYGPIRMYHLGTALYDLFVTEVDKLDGTPAALSDLVDEVKAALRRVTGFTD